MTVEFEDSESINGIPTIQLNQKFRTNHINTDNIPEELRAYFKEDVESISFE